MGTNLYLAANTLLLTGCIIMECKVKRVLRGWQSFWVAVACSDWVRDRCFFFFGHSFWCVGKWQERIEHRAASKGLLYDEQKYFKQSTREFLALSRLCSNCICSFVLQPELEISWQAQGSLNYCEIRHVIVAEVRDTRSQLRAEISPIQAKKSFSTEVWTLFCLS